MEAVHRIISNWNGVVRLEPCFVFGCFCYVLFFFRCGFLWWHWFEKTKHVYFPTQHASGLQSSEISSPLWGYPEHPDDVVLRTFSVGAQMFWFATLVFSQDFF